MLEYVYIYMHIYIVIFDVSQFQFQFSTLNVKEVSYVAKHYIFGPIVGALIYIYIYIYK